MRAKTEEMLMVLLWTVDVATAPTWRNLNSSYESWAYRQGFGPRLERMARNRLLEKRRVAGTENWLYRLTARGWRVAVGGRHPQAFWDRPWDGRWRMLLFDLPQGDRRLRMRLWRWLRAGGFGYLQNSVWITPDLSPTQLKEWTKKHPGVESFVLFEGRPAKGATDKEIVAGAWDFAAINERYSRYLAHLKSIPSPTRKTDDEKNDLLAWMREERALWSGAFQSDPLLPTCLLPRDYKGAMAWQRRQTVWKSLGRRVKKMTFD